MAISPDNTARADDFINESEKDATPANDAGRGVKLESDATISREFLRFIEAGGDDGNVVLDGTNTYSGFTTKSGNTYTLTRNIYPENLTIESGVTLVTDGYRFFVNDTIDGAGVLDWGVPEDGEDAPDLDNERGVGGAQTGSGLLKNQAGGNGGYGGNNCGGGAGGGTPELDPSILSKGGDGGAGESECEPDVNEGGTAGATPATIYPFGFVQSFSLGLYEMQGDTIKQIHSGTGGGGGGGGKDSGSTQDAFGGGGGGASGGLIWFYANKWKGSFTIKSVGGDGGDGGDNGGNTTNPSGGGGGGGAGGGAVIFYQAKTWNGTYNFSGGIAGTSAGSGESGQNGGDGESYELQII